MERAERIDRVQRPDSGEVGNTCYACVRRAPAGRYQSATRFGVRHTPRIVLDKARYKYWRRRLRHRRGDRSVRELEQAGDDILFASID